MKVPGDSSKCLTRCERGQFGLSRVYLGMHYPSDILAGQSAAIAWVFAVHVLVDRKAASPPPSAHRPLYREATCRGAITNPLPLERLLQAEHPRAWKASLCPIGRRGQFLVECDGARSSLRDRSRTEPHQALDGCPPVEMSIFGCLDGESRDICSDRLDPRRRRNRVRRR
jgi:hypothetical protein